MTVGEVCSDAVVTANSNDTVREAATRMRDRHVGCLVVVDEAGRPAGILTDRDIVVSAVAQSGDRLDGLLVGDIMTQPVVTAHRSDDLLRALARIRAHGVRRLPIVTSDGRLDGVLTFDDVLAALASELGGMVGLVTREQRREREVRP
jgi:CBS domain-containing protein